MPKVSIDLSLKNIYKSWFEFRRGKKNSDEIHKFEYYLENNLFNLWRDLNNNCYKPGVYKSFMVYESKKREIFVSSVKDRVVHRLVYNYLVNIYDKSFIFDVWSNRKGKGLLKAILRSKVFLEKYRNKFVWRADVQKFFDNVNHKTLLSIIALKIKDIKALKIIGEVIKSYQTIDEQGIPIGNLTSQIFSNIYLNELDRFIKHTLKPLAYLRYGDDFIIINNKEVIEKNRHASIDFLKNKLSLNMNNKNDIILKVEQWIKFLGVNIYSEKIELNNKNWRKALNNINISNLASYRALVKHFSNKNEINYFDYNILNKIDLI